MNKFEFDINKYSKEDLEEMLSLINPYTNQELFNKVQIVQMESLKKRPEVKEELKEFLSDVKQKLKKYDNFLIEHHNESNENKMNPISVNTLNKYLHFDSKFRKNYYSTSASDVTFTLPYVINNAIEMSLHEIDIPDSYYQISELLGNNSFIIVAKKGTDDQADVDTSVNYFTFDVSIPDGNWTIDTLVYYLNNTVFTTDWDAAINAQHTTSMSLDNYYYTRPTLSYGTTTGNQRIVANYSSYSNKIIIGINNINTSAIHIPLSGGVTYVELSGIELYFNVNPGTSADISNGTFQNTNSNLSVREKLGFMMGYKSAKYTGSTSYVGESPANLLSSSYFYLVIDDFIGNHIESNIINYTDSYNSKDIFTKISKNNMTPISTTKKTLDTQITNPLYLVSRKYLGPVTIKKLKLSIIDEFGRIIDLNNLDWSCTLRFTYMYD